MIEPADQRRPLITPALALRVAVLGGVALALFAIIFFRLWYLQVLSGEQYVAQARDNRVREINVQAPRGDVVDRNGTVLVRNRTAVAIQIAADELPPEGTARSRLYRRLGEVIGMRPARIRKEIQRQRRALPYANVTLKTDAPRTVNAYLFERQDQFPGVTVARVYLREYPHGQLAAHLFGTVGEIGSRELKEEHYRGVKQGTIVGKSGIEYSYDRYLRGRDGATRLQVDAFGRPKGDLNRREPVQGKQIKLSLDLGLQRAGERALARGIGLARANGNPARAGAFVALDPRNGEVLAMGSAPSFDPNVFSKPVREEVFAQLQEGSKLYNRALAPDYPTGSTFKVVTAAAALESGLISPQETINDRGEVKIGDPPTTFRNAGKVINGPISMRRALQVSSDVYFYTLGARANPRSDQLIQTWARRLGVGRETGIDLPGDFRGLIPDRKWRARIAAEEIKCRKRRGVPSCGISDGRPWAVGDNVNLSVGQGDIKASPLQMAVAYSAIANGGRVVTPHLGLEVEDTAGRLLQKVEPGPGRSAQLSSGTRQVILDGLFAAANAAGGTSADVFADWPKTLPIYGKTGTAERPPRRDQSWYIAYVPHRARPIVVAATIEDGGFGAEAAAPTAKLILADWFGVDAGKLVAGRSKTN